MKENATLIAATVLLGIALIGSFVLVGFDKMDAELALAVVVGPIVAGFIGFSAAQKGHQTGSQASVSPPPDA